MPSWRLIEKRRTRRRSQPEDLSDIGRTLRRRRARRRISLEQAARDTKIRRSYIEALESNAPVEAFPAPTYARAFLREYARYLGFDPERILAASEPLREAGPVRIAPLLASPPPEREVRWHIRAAAAGGLLVAALLVGGLESPPKPPPARPPVDLASLGGPLSNIGAPAGGSSASPVDEEEVATPPAPASAITLDVVVERYSSWVRVLADDAVAFEGTLTQGSVKRFEAVRSLRVVIGNAGAVRLTLNGQGMEVLGPRGAVRRLTFTLTDGRVEVSSTDTDSVVAAPPAE